MLKISKVTAIAAATMVTPIVAQAATLDGNYEVTAAISDRDGRAISLWFETALGDNLSTVFEIVNPGTLSIDATSGQLDAETVADTGAAGGFTIDMTFDRDFSDNADTTPEFKSVFADVFSHNGNEQFLDLEFGTITGTGGLTGLNFEIVRAPASGEYATQIGGGELDGVIGANQHNDNFGVSGWFTISAVSYDATSCILCTEDASFYTGLVGAQGDINMDLTPAAVPLPAAGLMLLSGLVGFGAMSRRRKSKS